jgi:hypothetical protein
MIEVVTVQDVLDKTCDDELIRSGLGFHLDRKRTLLDFFKSIGLDDTSLIELGKHLQRNDDSVPQGYLNFAEEVISESFGGLIHKYRMLLLSYTPFPYSPEESARLIQESLDKIINKYHRSSLVIQYTTQINPKPETFGELLTIGSFSPKDYGMIDIVGGIKVLLKDELFNVNFFEMLRANDDFIELRIVFESRAILTTEPRALSSNQAPVGRLWLDMSSPEPCIRYKEAELDLSSRSIEYFVLQELFDEFPNPALDENIIEAWGSDDKTQTLYDATRRINKKLMKLLKSDSKPVMHKNSKFWFVEQYKHLIEPLTKTDKP